MWQAKSACKQLKPQEIHIWRASLNQPTHTIVQLAKLLSPDEQERAQKYYFLRDQRRFTVARAALRLILASYLQTDPHNVQFCYGKWGKPALINNPTNLQFNSSHSQEMALYAFTLNQELGIDIEAVRALDDIGGMARHSFAPGEIAQLAKLPVEQHLEGFFLGWSRKEAFIKALGKGLSQDLTSFEVSLIPNMPAKLLSIEGDTQAAQRWLMQNIDAAEDYKAALAIVGENYQLSYYQWDAELSN